MKPGDFHPVSEIFPLMTGAAFDELVADIKANGLREPIWIYNAQIIDGRNRYLACEKAGVTPEFRQWDGNGDLTKFVISLNLHRRHLSESQRAMIAAKLATRPHGRNKRSASSANSPMSDLTTGEVSELMQVAETTVREAKRVHRDAAPEVVAAVEAGDVSLHMADRVRTLPKKDQPAALAKEKLMKGKRTIRAANGAKNRDIAPAGYVHMNDVNKVLITDNDNPESAAAEMFSSLNGDFLERLVTELTAIMARAKAAQQRGMGSARKEA